MKKDLFRKEVVEKITSPDGLNEYVKVIKPSVWMILGGIAIAAIGTTFFRIFTGYRVLDLFFGMLS